MVVCGSITSYGRQVPSLPRKLWVSPYISNWQGRRRNDGQADWGGAHVWIYLDGWVHKVLNLLDSCMGSDQILRAFNLGPCSGLIAVLRRVAECMYMAPATLGTWPRDYPNEVVI